ncbi:MAG: hypothetical protein ABJF23_09010 [Bryobacteraceae bacterium]
MSTSTGTTVSMAFSNLDASLPMTNTTGSTWRKDWQPRDASAGSAICTVTAFRPLPNGSILANQINIPVSIVRGGTVPLVAAGAVVNAASFAKAGPVAPGALISIFGEKLSGDQAQVASSVPLPTQLNDTEVRLGERALPLIYTSEGQLNVQVPYDLSVNTQHQLTVRRATALSVPEAITVAATQPGIFTVDQSGSGQGVIVGPTGQIVDSANPVKAGDIVVMYSGGLGAVNPPVASGAAAPAAAPTVNPVTVTIGGVPAAVAYAGLTPGTPGLYQLNVVIPAGIPAGDAVEVQIATAGQTSPPVTLALR